MQKITLEDFNFFKPPDFTIDEERYLCEQNRSTLLKNFPGYGVPDPGSQVVQGQMLIGTNYMPRLEL